ncbi:unnamed protein product, partial [marine sediment metagenome]
MSVELTEKIEKILQMPAEELREALPLTLDEIGNYGIEKMLKG